MISELSVGASCGELRCRQTHSGVHDSGPVCSDRVCDMSYVDRVQVLVVARTFDENLNKKPVIGHEFSVE